MFWGSFPHSGFCSGAKSICFFFKVRFDYLFFQVSAGIKKSNQNPLKDIRNGSNSKLGNSSTTHTDKEFLNNMHDMGMSQDEIKMGKRIFECMDRLAAQKQKVKSSSSRFENAIEDGKFNGTDEFSILEYISGHEES